MDNIPLINDMAKEFPNEDVVKIFINKYPDNKGENMLKLYKQLHNKYMSIDDICDYIRFVNYTLLESSEYLNIVPYINRENFCAIVSKIDNYDILDEFLIYLEYDIVSLYDKFDDFEQKWLSRKENFEWCVLNKNNILEKYLLDQLVYKYYKINGKIVDSAFTHNNDIFYYVSYIISIDRNIILEVYIYVMNHIDDYINKFSLPEGFNNIRTFVINYIYKYSNNNEIKQYLKMNYEAKDFGPGDLYNLITLVQQGFSVF